MEVAHQLLEHSKKIEGIQQLPFKAIAKALEVIPRTLAQNCGSDVIRVMTELRAKHSKDDGTFIGIDGHEGKIANMKDKEIWDPCAVKVQTFKTAIESACLLLRIDDIVSGMKSTKKESQGPPPDEDEEETFGDDPRRDMNHIDADDGLSFVRQRRHGRAGGPGS